MSKIHWDITTEEIYRLHEAGEAFFDPTLSYEITRYRPINQTQGLDFDQTPFTEVGKRYDSTKKFCTYPPVSKVFKDWWLEQHKFCDTGFEANGYRITGDHYFFLNFYTMLKSEAEKKAAAGRKDGRPEFWAAHYEFFHYIELCEVLGYDSVILKARGVGASEIAASLGVRPYTTTKGYNALYVAYAVNHLEAPKGVLGKCWKQLDWLNQNTGGGMRRARMGKNDDFTKKACMKDKTGEESGHMAVISGQVVDRADKLRGDRVDRLFFEESGSNPCLSDTWVVGEALVIINGRRHGCRIAWGTGGSDGPYLEGLEKMFLDPITYSVLPYRHHNTIKGEVALTSYFIPAWATVMDTMDERGVVDEDRAKAYYNKIRDTKKKDFNLYSKYCSEYCFYPEEALSRQGNNNFDQEKLADQYTEIVFNKSTPIVEHGYTKWDYEKDASNNSTSRVIGSKFIVAPNGNTHILEMPVLDENNQFIKDLYVAGIDSIDKALGDSMDDKGSKFCVTIKKRTFGMEGDKYVAFYMDRPYDIREAYEKCAQLLTMYNCKANLEDTKIGIIGYYREKHWLHLLMKRPQYAIQGDARRPPNAFGTQGTEKMILHAIDLVDAYIKDYCHLIGFIEMVEQLQNYSWEKKGKFDIVASMGMCEIGDEELMGIVPKKELVEAETVRDIGHYFVNGIRKWGIIPDNYNHNNKHLNAALNGYNQF
jgi:hypothetical protein